MIARSIGSNGSDHARGRWEQHPALALARAACADTAVMMVPDNGVCMDYVKVGRAWLDYNDHMNVAFYLKAFDDASDKLTAVAGMGQAYTQATSNSWVALESHLSFQAEARLGDALRIESRVLEVDEKNCTSTRKCIATIRCSRPMSNLAYISIRRRGGAVALRTRFTPT